MNYGRRIWWSPENILNEYEKNCDVLLKDIKKMVKRMVTRPCRHNIMNMADFLQSIDGF